VATDPGVDLIALQGQLPMDLAEAASDRADYAALAASTEKPIAIFSRMHQNVTEDGRAIQRASGVPYLQGIPDAIRALQNLIGYAAARRRTPPAPLPPPKTDRSAHDVTTNDLLLHYGITLPHELMTKSPTAAAAAAARIGFPVAIKIVSPAASHKTEVGGVALNLGSEQEVERQAQAMFERLRTLHPSATLDGYLVQEMVHGVEMIVGVRNDAQFGPVVVAGLGGIATELLSDVAVRLLPVDEASIRDMLSSLRGAPLLGAYRGRKSLDVAALTRSILGLSQLYIDHRHHICEIEINPLVVLEEGCGVRALDVRVIRH
jgi:acetyltransferase